jgi:hypothetical protein
MLPYINKELANNDDANNTQLTKQIGEPKGR